jgi:parvulin-like peptidyl-prolyl isomerase
MAKENNKNLHNKKHIAKRKHEEKMIKTMRTIGIVVAAVVVATVLFGLVYNFLVVPPQAVAVVNGEKITTEQFQAKAKYARFNIVNQYDQAYQMYQFMGQYAPDYASQYLYQMYQLYYSMQTIGTSSYQAIIDDVMTRQKAVEMGMTVTEDEIDAKIQELLNYYPDGAPVVSDATLVPTETAVEETASEEVTPTAVPTEYTQDLYESNYDTLMANVRSQAGLSEEMFRYLVELDLYVDKVKATYTEEVGNPTEEVVWAKHILVETEAEALALLDQLDEGAAWDDLALANSLDTSNNTTGGDLGWFTKDEMVAEFADAAFAGNIGDIVGPVQTSYGYHLIMIVGHEDRAMDANGIQNLIDEKYYADVAEWENASTIEMMDNYVNRTPNSPTIPATKLAPLSNLGI